MVGALGKKVSASAAAAIPLPRPRPTLDIWLSDRGGERDQDWKPIGEGEREREREKSYMYSEPKTICYECARRQQSHAPPAIKIKGNLCASYST